MLSAKMSATKLAAASIASGISMSPGRSMSPDRVMNLAIEVLDMNFLVMKLTRCFPRIPHGSAAISLTGAQPWALLARSGCGQNLLVGDLAARSRSVAQPYPFPGGAVGTRGPAT